MLLLIFIPTTDFGDKRNQWTDLENAAYIAGGRPLWAFACAILTLLCYYDYLPLINGILSHWMWTPLARLTYGAYLCHPLVIKLAAANSAAYYNFGVLDMLYR